MLSYKDIEKLNAVITTNFKQPLEKPKSSKLCSCGEEDKIQGTRYGIICLKAKAHEKAKESLIKQRQKSTALKKKERKLKKREKKANSISRLTKRADTLFSLAVRKRDGKSRKSGSSENLQCSHIWSRANKAIRWDLDNALTLTAGEHLYWWHKEPVEAIEWARTLLGETVWAELNRKRNMPFKLTVEFLKERIEFLTSYIKKYE